jgi:hypothetical protein
MCCSSNSTFEVNPLRCNGDVAGFDTSNFLPLTFEKNWLPPFEGSQRDCCNGLFSGSAAATVHGNNAVEAL